MCGRYHVSKSAEEIEAVFGVTIDKENYRSNYNAAPSQFLPLIANNIPDKIQYFKWGLIPSWAKDEKLAFNMINARIDTIREKPTFKNLVDKKRCIVVSDGYYEWKKLSEKEKLPHRICREDQKLFAFAGIWTEWINPVGGEIIPTFSIITRDPYPKLLEIHQRMPIMLNVDIAKGWLMNELQVEQLQSEMITEKELIYYPVSKSVGKVANNTPELMEEVKL